MIKNLNRRMWAFFIVFALLNAAVIGRIYLVGINEKTAADLSYSGFSLTIEHKRGTIFDRNGRPLTNDKTQTVAVFTPQTLSDDRINMYLTETQINALKSGTPVAADVDDSFEMTGAYTADVNRSSDRSPAHLLGYIDSDGKGISGVEQSFDKILSGGDICCIVRRDALGNALSQGVKFSGGDNKTGSVTLTIDSEWQSALESAAKRYIKKGAAIALDMNTAEILASVSLPEYKKSRIADYLDDPDSPFVNRAISAFPVGSVFKISTAAAALSKGVSLDYTCRGTLTLGNAKFGCMNGRAHGALTLESALGVSCNTYFVTLSTMLKSTDLLNTAKLLGFGAGVRLCGGISSASGSLPSAEELTISGEKANFAFGQGRLTASPLQIASVIQTVAGGGQRAVPTLIKSVTDKSGKTSEPTAEPPVRALSAQTADTLKKYLRSAAENGTAASGKVNGLTVGGKTATAETGGSLDAWFAGYCDELGVCIAVLCENGSSGSQDAAPVFRQALSAMQEKKLRRN